MLSGRTVRGPRWVRERHGFLSVPLLARPGSVIPFGAAYDRPDADWADGITLRVYEPSALPGTGVTVRVPAPDGSTAVAFTVVRDGETLRAEAVDRAPAPWRVEVVGGPSADAEAGTAALTLALSSDGA